jgi:PTH1 family peptidyl-tRNA hydrolase
MKLLVGLGNPGKKYSLTRHNVGFLLIENLIKTYQLPQLKLNKNFKALIVKTKLDDKNFFIALPQTYMNNSGQAVKKICSFYKIKPEDIIVAHDEIDLPLGKFKISFNRGSAGHQGVQSIINQLKTKNFWRLRIGVGPKIKSPSFPTERFVLENFKKDELKQFNDLFEILNQEIIKLLKN